MKTPSSRFLGFALIAVSLLPISNGAGLYTAQKAFIAESVARQAIVIGQQPAVTTPGNPRNNEVQSIVEFTDNNGRLTTAPTNVSSYPAPFEIGEAITVRVHTTNTEDVRVDSFTGMWFESAFFLVPGLFFMLGGVYMVRRNKRN